METDARHLARCHSRLGYVELCRTPHRRTSENALPHIPRVNKGKKKKERWVRIYSTLRRFPACSLFLKHLVVLIG
jgi:hypothetical protein